MGILRATKYKTFLKLSAAVFVLFAVIVSALASSIHTSAATSLTFSWKDAQTIAVSGTLNGTIAGSVTPSGQLPFSGSVVATPVDLCNRLYVTVDTANNTATLESVNDGGVYSSTTKPCYEETLGINGPLSINGARPSTATETSDQKKVNIELDSNLTKDKSPQTVKFTLKDSSGKTLFNDSVSKSITDTFAGNGSAGTNYIVKYSRTFSLDPGTYNICFSSFENDCQSFTKVKYLQLNKTYGTRGSYNSINVSVRMDVYTTTGSSYTLSGQTIELKQAGKVLKTEKTAAYTHTPSASEISSSSGTLSKINISFKTVAFSGMSPGTYKVCLVSNGSCVDVKKIADQPTSPNPIVLNADLSDVQGVKAPFDANQCGDKSNAESDACTTALPTCESNGFSLSWIMCPVVNGLASAADGIYTNLVQPLLVTPPLSNDNSASDKIYKAWSAFRTYGDIFLVIALLVTVLGQTIGGGFIDAYTAKKIIPRVLLAAILINLSYYFVGLMMDVTNVIGIGLVNLITAPFELSGDLGITLNGGSSAILGIGSLVGIGLALANYGALFGLLWTVVLIPTLFAFLAIAVTLLFRKGLLIFLVLISPIAFALYVLPNTEKYFKQWWNLLFKTLMVFPIIAALFGISKVLAYTLDWANDTGGLSSSIADIMSVVALIIPLFLIPFAFKIAGGVIGQVSNLASTATKNAQKLGYFKHGRERALVNAKGVSLQRKQNTYANLQKSASNRSNSFLKRKGAGLLANRIGGYNIEAEMSSERSRVGKEMGDQIGAGVDQQVRGVTVNKTVSTIENGLKRVSADGITQYKSLGGGWVNEADVDAGHARWGKSTFAQQFALSYEMSKATTEEQVQNLATNYRAVATGPGGWGNTDNQAGGSWVGASFQNQNQHLALKHTDWKTGSFIDTSGNSKSEGFVDEIYEKKGSYPLAQMSSFTIEKLKQAYEASGNVDERQKISAIAETFMHELSSGGQIGVTGEGDKSTRIELPGTPGRRQAGSAGSAHVAERVRELAEMTGVLVNGPSGPYSATHDEKTPPPSPSNPTIPNQRSQK